MTDLLSLTPSRIGRVPATVTGLAPPRTLGIGGTVKDGTVHQIQHLLFHFLRP